MITPASFSVANARYTVLAWEPVAATGERLNVAAIAEYCGQCVARLLIREDVLTSLYGSAGIGAFAMIKAAMEAAEKIASNAGLESAAASGLLGNFSFSRLYETHATSEVDLFREIVLMNCSLGILADEYAETADDSPASETEINRQWSTRIRDAVLSAQPGLHNYFVKNEAILVDGGVPVKFGFWSPRTVAHFGLLRATHQSNGMKDAKAKMWDLSLAKERNQHMTAALLMGLLDNAVTLSDKQLAQLELNETELKQEAEHKNLLLKTVTSVDEAALEVIALA